MVTLCWIPAVSWPLISRTISAHFFRLTVDRIEVKFGEITQRVTPLVWFTFHHASPTSKVSWPLIDREVSANFQTNRWLDWAGIYWAKSLWASSLLINIWSCSSEFRQFPALWFVDQFLPICNYNTDWAEISWANSLWSSLALVNFWSRFAGFPLFPGLCLFEQFSHIFRQTAVWIELRFGETIYGGFLTFFNL